MQFHVGITNFFFENKKLNELQFIMHTHLYTYPLVRNHTVFVFKSFIYSDNDFFSLKMYSNYQIFSRRLFSVDWLNQKHFTVCAFNYLFACFFIVTLKKDEIKKRNKREKNCCFGWMVIYIWYLNISSINWVKCVSQTLLQYTHIRTRARAYEYTHARTIHSMWLETLK